VRACEGARETPERAEWAETGNEKLGAEAAVAMTVTSGVGERTRPFPHARARAYTHRDMHTRAHGRSPSDTLEGKVKLKARERRDQREPPLRRAP
jgi:hypothetical protein